jgi:hypothetical protein
MVRNQLKRAADAENLLACADWIQGGDEFEWSLKVAQRARSYFDPRHARALGRRTLLPATRASRKPKATPRILKSIFAQISPRSAKDMLRSLATMT